jgi:FAD/FMN-containing dehydrogenase
MSTAPTESVSDAAELAPLLHGALLTPDDPAYEAECAGYNLAATRRPAFVVVAEDADDVVATVGFAARRGLRVDVLATGHHAASYAGSVLITTRRMSRVEIDPLARRATVGGGALWGQVVDAATPHGLAPLNGSSPLVGVVGYTLGGGLSPTLGRTFGWAAERVTAVELVTADGTLRRASAEEHPDLFWAIRGGGTGLGVITSLEFELFPVERMYAGALYFDGADAEAVLRAYARLAADAPDALTSSVALLRLPPLEAVPEPLRGRLSVHVRVAFLGDPADGEVLLAELRRSAPLLIDAVRDMPYADFAQIHTDPVDPTPFAERTAMLTSLSEEAIETVVRLVGPAADCPVPVVELRQLGGALARTTSTPAAVEHGDAAFALWTASIGMPSDVGPAVAYAERLIAELGPWTTGRSYRNFLGDGEPATAYAPDTWQRLGAIRRAHDPAGTFTTDHTTDAAPRRENGTDPMTPQTSTPAPTTIEDRLGVADVLHRYTEGLDLGDAELLGAALTEDAVVDLTPATERLGMAFPVLQPRSAVIEALMTYVGPLDTSHSITNLQVDVAGDEATARCYCQGRHFLPGEGPDPAATRHALMMSRYDVALRRGPDGWRIAHLKISLAWFEGDPLVLVAMGA